MKKRYAQLYPIAIFMSRNIVSNLINNVLFPMLQLFFDIHFSFPSDWPVKECANVNKVYAEIQQIPEMNRDTEFQG